METMTPASELENRIRLLRVRADQLRKQAVSFPEPAAVAMRRRASEIELEAWVLTVRTADTPAELLAA